MHNPDLGSLPDDLKPLLASLVGSVHSILANQDFVESVWFMVDRRNERAMPVVVPLDKDLDKHRLADFIRTLVLAQQPDVDAVIFICEAWKKKLEKGDPRFRDEKVQVRDMPGREDIIMFIVETYDGTWTASPVVIGTPGSARTLATVEFEWLQAVEGAMASFLPPRNKHEVN